MAAKSKSLQVIGKHLVNSLRSCAFPRAVASDLSASRNAHTSAYDKNVEEELQPSKVPDELIKSESDKYWSPHPQTGVFGPSSSSTTDTADEKLSREYLNRSDSNVLQSPTSVAKLPPNTAVRTTRRKTTVKAEPQPSSSQLVNRSCQETLEADKAISEEGSKQNDNDHEIGDTEIYIDLGDTLFSEHANTETNNDNEESKNVQAFDSLVQVEHQETEEAIHENFFENEKTNTLVEAVMNRTDGVSEAEPEEDNSSVDSDGTISEAGSNQTDNRETEHAIQVNDSETEKTNTLDKDKMVDQTDGDSETESEGDIEIYVDLEAVVDQTDGDLEGDHSGVDSDVTISEADSNQAVHGIHGSDIVDAKMKSKGSICIFGGIWHILTKPFAWARRALVWSGEAYLSYSLAALSVCGFIACCFVWFNNTAYPSEFYGPTGPEASQAQAFTFLVRDQRLGANVGSAQGPTGLGKYLMRSPTGEVIFGGETMRFWDLRAPWLEPLRGPNGLDLRGVATEINAVNYVSPRSWLSTSHFVLGFFLFVGHLWHAGRARAAAAGFEKGIDRDFEPVLSMTPLN
ncbi:hypothetical protein F2Q69_00044700 [Brassica cretica]|uniref:Photosystem II CP43 reaction center protein n=1 Tax=Brassica cretica TaxID=69181 RepID=A0A8S9NAW9_BRACR|nr:hypothetical protein F2Q69_00044700 [Brassica cretica]